MKYISVITLFLALIGGMAFCEDRWNQVTVTATNTTKIESVEQVALAKIENVEKNTVDALKLFQKMQNIRFQQQRLDTLNDQLMQTSIDVERNPGSQELTLRKKTIFENKEKTTKKLDKLLSDMEIIE